MLKDTRFTDRKELHERQMTIYNFNWKKAKRNGNNTQVWYTIHRNTPNASECHFILVSVSCTRSSITKSTRSKLKTKAKKTHKSRQHDLSKYFNVFAINFVKEISYFGWAVCAVSCLAISLKNLVFFSIATFSFDERIQLRACTYVRCTLRIEVQTR